MSLPNRVADGIRSAQIVTCRMEYGRFGPCHVSLRRVFRPSADKEMVFVILTFENVSSPERKFRILNPVVNVPETYRVSSPHILAGLPVGHRQKPVFKPPSINKVLPFGGQCTFCDLSVYTQAEQ